MDYYHRLFSLYLKTNTLNINKKEIKHNRKFLYNEFYRWIPIYMEQAQEYKKYLESFLNVNLNNPNIAEFDKGYVDSVVDDDALMLSDFAFTKGYYENSNLTIRDRDILVIEKNNELFPLDRIETLITHNPYTSYEWNRAEKIIKAANTNIIFGVFGDINDFNKKERIDSLKRLKEKLQNVKEDYNEKEDNYFYVLTRK